MVCGKGKCRGGWLMGTWNLWILPQRSKLRRRKFCFIDILQKSQLPCTFLRICRSNWNSTDRSLWLHRWFWSENDKKLKNLINGVFFSENKNKFNFFLVKLNNLYDWKVCVFVKEIQILIFNVILLNVCKLSKFKWNFSSFNRESFIK